MNRTNVENILDKENEFIFPIKGKSMMPLFRQDKDCIIISKANIDSLKKYDIVMYQGASNLILHRILKIKDDTLIIRGDNTFTKEYRKKEDIIGVATKFYRDENIKDLSNRSFKFYIRFWNIIYPIRYLIHGMKVMVKKIWKK